MVYDGYKYGAPGIAAPVYRVTEENPIVDEKRQWTLLEVLDRLEALKEVLPGVPAGYEQEVVQGTIQEMEDLLAQHKQKG
jgi:hypothetical protein